MLLKSAAKTGIFGCGCKKLRQQGKHMIVGRIGHNLVGSKTLEKIEAKNC
jgi:hypothetical protein